MDSSEIIAGAAASLLAIGAGAYYYVQKRHQNEPPLYPGYPVVGSVDLLPLAKARKMALWMRDAQLKWGKVMKLSLLGTDTYVRGCD